MAAGEDLGLDLRRLLDQQWRTFDDMLEQQQQTFAKQLDQQQQKWQQQVARIEAMTDKEEQQWQEQHQQWQEQQATFKGKLEKEQKLRQEQVEHFAQLDQRLVKLEEQHDERCSRSSSPRRRSRSDWLFVCKL